MEMREFDLLGAPRSWSKVDEQTRTSTIRGGTFVAVFGFSNQAGGALNNSGTCESWTLNNSGSLNNRSGATLIIGLGLDNNCGGTLNDLSTTVQTNYGNRTVSLTWFLCGCATQMVEHDAKESCAGQGKKAFIFNARQQGVPLLIESASAMVLCAGPDDVVHLTDSFGVDAVSASNLSGAGILSVSAGSVADKAAIKSNDIICEFAGTPIGNACELRFYIDRGVRGRTNGYQATP